MEWVGRAFFVFVLAVVIFQTHRARKVGPRVHWVPPVWRPALNRYYRDRGWPEPFDANGGKRDFWEPVEGLTTPADDRSARFVRRAITVVVVVGCILTIVQIARP